MPRTKIVKKRRATTGSSTNDTTNVSQPRKKDLKEKIVELKQGFKSSIYELQLLQDKSEIEIRNFYDELTTNVLQTGLGHKTWDEIRALTDEDLKAINDAKTGFKKATMVKPKSVVRSARKRSNSCSSRRKKPTSASRSASCDRPARTIIAGSASKMRTPLNCNIPAAAFIPVVTPKVNPNQPVSILRRPRQGEHALSLSGSPLMVSGITVDDMVSVTVPMADGRVLSILPTDGIDAASLILDEETRSQLMKLRINLSKCLLMHNT